MASYGKRNKSGIKSSFLGSLLSALLVMGIAVAGIATYNHFENDNATQEVENEEVEDKVEDETPSESDETQGEQNEDM